MHSLLGEDEAFSRQTRIAAKNDYNFWSDRWIALTFSHEFPEDGFLGVAMESLLSEEEVFSRQTRIAAKTGFTFDSIVGPPSNIYSYFWRPFSLE
jgi:hypothetical protein